MSSQTELLLALVNELPYVQSLLSDIKQLKKDVKYEKKQAKKWRKKHDALLNILHDYPSLMHHEVKQEVIDLTNEDIIEEVSSIKISYDPVQIKEENIAQDDDLSVEGEIIEIQTDENEVKETLPTENNTKEEVVVEQEESEEEVEVVEESEEEVEVVEESEEEEVEVVEESEEEEVEVVEESEEEEEEVVEESEEEEEEVVEESEEEEEEELFEMEIGGKSYFVTDEKNGVIYEALEDDDVGEMLGHLKDGKAVWNKKVKKVKK